MLCTTDLRGLWLMINVLRNDSLFQLMRSNQSQSMKYKEKDKWRGITLINEIFDNYLKWYKMKLNHIITGCHFKVTCIVMKRIHITNPVTVE